LQLGEKRKIKILFIINSLEGGGAEKVFVNIVNRLYDELTDNLDVALLKKQGVYLANLKERIKIIDLGVKSEKIGKYLPSIIRQLYRLEKNYDCIFSFMWESNFINLLVSVFSKKIRIISERINLEEYLNSTFTGLKKMIIFSATKFLYKKANLIVTPSTGLKTQLNNVLRINEKNIKVIPNPFDLKNIKYFSTEDIEFFQPFILFVGRLHKQKNIPLLLKAFKNLKNKDIKLIIIGEGEEKSTLRSMIKALDLSDRVNMMGFQKNPYKYMSKALCLVLPSNYEAFPNVIIEAMVCGCPVISTDCPFGPSEIIQNEKNGILIPVNDASGLSSALEKIVSDEKLRTKLIENAYETVKNYDIEKIVQEYKKAILEVN